MFLFLKWVEMGCFYVNPIQFFCFKPVKMNRVYVSLTRVDY